MELKVRDGARIYYETYGDKKNKTIIFLHGNMEDSSLFNKQVEHFSLKYHVIVPDTRGHGKSEWVISGRYNLKILAEDLQELVIGLELNNYIVVGFSDGANIAMEFATIVDEGLKGLVLVGGNLRPWGMKNGIILDIIKDYIKSYKNEDGGKNRRKLGLMLFEPRIEKKNLAVIKVPTLVLAGENDLIRKRETLKIGRYIKGSEVVFIENADHFFIYNKWDIFNKMLELWINSV
jgi:pimeloyl-ACP methyl ester carboxylesterase